MCVTSQQVNEPGTLGQSFLNSSFSETPQWDNKILEGGYSHVPEAFDPAAAPHLLMLDHISENLVPAYTPLIQHQPPELHK